jgi:beta-galactosidase
VAVGDDGVALGDVVVAWPELSVMRAPTDNDGIQVGWMTGVGARGRWVRWGIDRLSGRETKRRRTPAGAVERRVEWHPAGEGDPIIHHQTVSLIGGEGTVRFDERVAVPQRYRDLARVGVCFVLPAGFEDIGWYGLGPHDTYPDRCRAELGRFRSTVTDQYVDFVFPQHHGTHHDTRWFELSGPGRPRLRVVADRAIAFDVSHFTVSDLSAARHTTDLVARPETFVHLDVAHRGLGTASCGPDTLAPYLVGAGRYRWSWEIRGAAR